MITRAGAGRSFRGLQTVVLDNGRPGGRPA